VTWDNEGFSPPEWYVERAGTEEVSKLSEDPGHRTGSLAFMAWAFDGKPFPKRILDVGCADGWMLGQFEQRGIRATGITLKLSEVTGGLAYEGDMHTFDLRPIGLFDGVWCRHVLEHALAPHVAMRNFRRHLAAGGHLWIVLPGPGWDTMPLHYSPMNSSQFSALAGKTGFRVTRDMTISVASLGAREGCPDDVELWFDCEAV